VRFIEVSWMLSDEISENWIFLEKFDMESERAKNPGCQRMEV